LDGLAVLEAPAYDCHYKSNGDTLPKELSPLPLLKALPDISVRFAVASSSLDATLSLGPASITSKGGVYRAVLDYVNVDDIAVIFWIRKNVDSAGVPVPRKPLASTISSERILSFEAHLSIRNTFAAETKDSSEKRTIDSEAKVMGADQYELLTVPVYVGIGMRLSADIRAFKKGIALTSLGAIAAAAQSDALSGTLTVQTLGLTGRPIATALPLPSKLDQTSVENGILALGSSRALIYSSDSSVDEVTKTPRIVGLFSPIGADPRLIAAIYSELASQPQTWFRACTVHQ
jgi:hypothetical protein